MYCLFDCFPGLCVGVGRVGLCGWYAGAVGEGVVVCLCCLFVYSLVVCFLVVCFVLLCRHAYGSVIRLQQ